MAYGQKNYPQIQGINGRYTIAQIGCFITAFCNLLERFGEGIDPPTLNNFFVGNGIYIDVDDGVRDDVGWGTVSARDGNIAVTGTGNGAPPVNDAIVKFIYRSISNPTLPNGKPNMISHFCLVADAAKGLIIDSWDGVVKSWNVYGGPLAYATYAKNTPQPVIPASPPLPPAPGHPYRVENIDPIELAVNKQPTHAWNLDTTTWAGFKSVQDLNKGDGFRAVAKAHHNLGGVYYMADPNVAQGINVVDADVPPPPAPTPPAPEAPAKPANITYTKLETPLDLVANKQPTHWWNLDFKTYPEAKAAADIGQGTPFRAFGRAQRTDLDKPAYFMTEEDFGQADTTGSPAHNNGVNTVDLSPAPAPTPPAPETPAPETPAKTPESAPEGDKVPVTVNSWKDSFKQAYGVYKSVKDVAVKDLDGKKPDTALGHDVIVKVAGTFEKSGETFYRTLKSMNEGAWYGIPKDALLPTAKSKSIGEEAGDDIDAIVADIRKDPEFTKFKHQLSPRGRAITTIAEVEDTLAKILSKINIFKLFRKR